MEKTWKPTVAGILSIVSGALGLTVTMALVVAITVTGSFTNFPGRGDIPVFVPSLLTAIAFPLAVVSVLALVGGIFAIQRKIWGLALAGCIAAIFASTPLLGGLPVGILATIFVALAKNEFQ